MHETAAAEHRVVADRLAACKIGAFLRFGISVVYLKRVDASLASLEREVIWSLKVQ